MDVYSGLNSGLANLSKVIDDDRTYQMQHQTMNRQNSLADLQMQTAQIGIDDTNAKQGAKMKAYGVSTPEDAYAAEMKAKLAADKSDRTVKHLESIKAFKGMGATPEFITKYTQSEMMKDPEMAKIAPFVSFIDDTKMEITKDFKDGEIQDPFKPGTFFPAGKYKVVGIATGDPANPYKFDKVEPAKADAETLLDKRLAAQEAMQDKTIAAADRRTAQQIAAAAEGRAEHKQNAPGKTLPAGQLESIAEMKRVKDVLAEAGALMKSTNVTTGPVAGRLQSLGAKVGASSDDFVNVQQKLQTAQNIMLKLRSGAAVTESEYARFLKEFPTPNETGEVFNRKMNNAVNYASTLMDEKMDIYEEGGYKVPRKAASRGARPTGAKTKSDPLGIL
jgi:hypothetical protein